MTSLRRQALALLLLTSIMFWWRLGHLGLIDPDEPFYAQTVREMVQRNDWMTPHIFGQPQFEKPILFYWQGMVAQKIFGDNEFAARAPSALFATGLVFLTWAFGRRLLGPRAGFLAAVVMTTGMMVAFMARLMLTDISLAFFITAALYGLWMAVHDEEHRDRWVIFQLVMSGLATLTKGPIGVLVPALGGVAFLRLTKTRLPWRGRGLWIGLAAWTVIVVPWYAVTLARYGWEFWDEFFYRDNWLRFVTAEHPSMNRILGINVSGIHFYPEILLVGMFPWMPLVVAATGRMFRAARQNQGVLFVVCWLLPSLIFMTVAQSKLPSYIFFLFPPLALLMGHTLDAWLESGLCGTGEKALAGIFAGVQAVALIVATLVKPEYAEVREYAVAISVPLAVAAGLLFAGRLRGWIFASLTASLTVIALAFTGLAPTLEGRISSRAIVEQIKDVRHAGEPVVTVKFMVRSVAYYNHEDPAAVFAGDPHPWFSPHPIRVLVSSAENAYQGLADFTAQHPSVLIAAQPSDLKRLDAPGSPFQGHCEKLRETGDRVLFRVTLPQRVTAN